MKNSLTYLHNKEMENFMKNQRGNVCFCGGKFYLFSAGISTFFERIKVDKGNKFRLKLRIRLRGNSHDLLYTDLRSSRKFADQSSP